MLSDGSPANLLKLIFLRLTTIVSRILSVLDWSLIISYAFCSSSKLLESFSKRSVLDAFSDYFSKWLTSNSVSAKLLALDASLALDACLLLLNLALLNEVKLTILPTFIISVFSGSKLFIYIFYGDLLATISNSASYSIVIFLLNSSSNRL